MNLAKHSPMKLYTVHLHLSVRLTRTGRRTRTQAIRMRLVVAATGEADARGRAQRWFERESTGPLAGPTFGTGLWDASEVRLVETPVRPAIEVFENDGDVMVVS